MQSSLQLFPVCYRSKYYAVDRVTVDIPGVRVQLCSLPHYLVSRPSHWGAMFGWVRPVLIDVSNPPLSSNPLLNTHVTHQLRPDLIRPHAPHTQSSTQTARGSDGTSLCGGETGHVNERYVCVSPSARAVSSLGHQRTPPPSPTSPCRIITKLYNVITHNSGVTQ